MANDTFGNISNLATIAVVGLGAWLLYKSGILTGLGNLLGGNGGGGSGDQTTLSDLSQFGLTTEPLTPSTFKAYLQNAVIQQAPQTAGGNVILSGQTVQSLFGTNAILPPAVGGNVIFSPSLGYAIGSANNPPATSGGALMSTPIMSIAKAGNTSILPSALTFRNPFTGK